MHPMPFRRPELRDVADQAQNMASRTKQERIAFACSTVAVGCMGLMAITAAAQSIRDLLRSEHRDRAGGRGRG
jgi:hypothetical protein